ncbi:diacylglycerol kinase [Alteromonas sp. CYL-A6]|uniref:diacylglycerol kinase n=1 Tax=Alteromonas nitratireducens TaxID=3390813 RepID=UPI0034A88DDD
MIKKTRGIKRIAFATKYSLQGLAAAFKSEPAIRQELAVCVILIPLACVLDTTITETLLMILVLGLVLITELLNSAVEALADHISTDMHALLGKAKDIGSAAVFIALIQAGVVWGVILYNVITR